MKLAFKYLLIVQVLLLGFKGYAQTNNDIYIEYISFDVDFSIDQWPAIIKNPVNSKSEFDNLMTKMNERGYFEASVDSIYGKQEGIFAIIHVGSKYFLGSLKSLSIPDRIFNEYIDEQGMDWHEFTNAKGELLQYYRDSGYFNAQIFLDDIDIEENIVNASVEVERGFMLRIDTIINIGELQINQRFLENTIGLKKGDVFTEEKLTLISDRIRSLKFASLAKSAEVIVSGDRASIMLDISKKKVNNAEFLLGIIPSVSGKASIHGLADIKLFNSFNRGSEISLSWERLKRKTQEVSLNATYPFLFNLPVSIEGGFHLYKQDSLWVSTRSRIGFRYLNSGRHRSGLFFAANNSRVLEYDTIMISPEELPEKIDFNEVEFGFQYEFNTLDDPNVPREGIKMNMDLSYGKKSYRKNEKVAKYYMNNSSESENLYEALSLKVNSLNFRSGLDKYWRAPGNSVFRTSINFQYKTAENGFDNEMIRTGGINSFRGVGERSVLASTIIYSNLEYRFIFSKGSFLSLFTDLGYFAAVNRDEKFAVSFGPGIFLKTKAGIFKMTTAMSTYYEPFSFRNTNVHIGYVSRF